MVDFKMNSNIKKFISAGKGMISRSLFAGDFFVFGGVADHKMMT